MRDIITMLVYLYLLVALATYFYMLKNLEQKYPVGTLDFYTTFILLISSMMWWTVGIAVWSWYLDQAVFLCRLWWYENIVIPIRRRQWEQRYKSSWKEASRAIVKEEP